MTGTFEFDPTSETFVFRVDGQSASVSWNSNARKFEVWITSPPPFSLPQQIPIQVGGLFLTLKALYRLTRPQAIETSSSPEHENAYDRRERECIRFEDRNGKVEGVDR